MFFLCYERTTYVFVYVWLVPQDVFPDETVIKVFLVFRKRFLGHLSTYKVFIVG